MLGPTSVNDVALGVQKVQRLEHTRQQGLDGARLHQVGQAALLSQHPQRLSQRLKRHADVLPLGALNLERVQHGTHVLPSRVVRLGGEHLLRRVHLAPGSGLHGGSVVADLEGDVPLALPGQPAVSQSDTGFDRWGKWDTPLTNA